MSLLRSRRFLAGGVALAAGTAAVAAPAVAPPLSAGPLDDAEVDPSVNGDSGTYESCTAMFGLTDKSNAAYVTFTVEGNASPLPAIGDGLTPVLTVAVGDEVQECEPEVGFDDTASWRSYFDLADDSPIALAGFPYPGTPGYLIPLPFVMLTSVAPAAPGPLDLDLRIEQSNPDLTVTSAPTTFSFSEPPNDEEALAEIIDELGGPSSPLGTALQTLVDADSCVAPYEDPTDLALALAALTGVPESVYVDEGFDTCSEVFFATELRIAQIQLAGWAREVVVTVTAPTPQPTPGPTPGPTPAPVTPKFTG